MFIYSLSFFLTSTAFVSTNAKHGIPLLRYTVFLKNCPLAPVANAYRVFLVRETGLRTLAHALRRGDRFKWHRFLVRETELRTLAHALRRGDGCK